MTSRDSLIAGAGLGAAAMFFLDPARGPRRRAAVRDAVTHAATVTQRGAGKIGRDVTHRLYGTAAAVGRVAKSETAHDSVLEARVRARLGRLVSHPHAIHVAVTNGVTTLSGPILDHEAGPVVRAVARVRGVVDVVDQLDRHKQADGHPSLQGGDVPARAGLDVLQENWAPATRCTAATAGLLLIAAGARRRDAAGATAAAVGSLLLGRAALNLPVHRLVGVGSGRRAVEVQKTATIDAPIDIVYAFWASFENFPYFMSRVLEVRPSERVAGLSHWKVAGPAGVPVEFDAEVTREIRNELLAWRTLPGASVAHAGMVRFEPESSGRTRIQVRMSYTPPAGWLGHGVAKLFGVDPKHSMDEDLVRMKTMIEAGRIPRDAAQPIAATDASA